MRIVLLSLIVLSLSLAAWAEPKNSEWKSTTGNTIRIYDQAQAQFTLQILGTDGSCRIAYGSWIDQPNTFTYNLNDGGSAFVASFIDGGWSLKVVGRGQTNVWKFVRWIK